MSARLHMQVNAPSPSTSPQVTAPARLLQRKCACGGSAALTGKCEECRRQKLIRGRDASVAGEQSDMPSIVNDALNSPGRPLDAPTRGFMETRLGHDFSQVRIHRDEQAAESAKAINALAYTVGNDVFFGSGQYAPETPEGKRVLAHELTHTIQQRAGAAAPASTPLGMSRSDDAAEQEASAVETAITRDAPVPPIRTRAAHIARQEAAKPLVADAPPRPAASSVMRTVKVWLNAFIPKDISGLTKPATGHPGKTMIPGPTPVSDCFMTDQRDFDANIHASSRMHSEIEIDIAGPSENFQWHNCDATHEIDCEDGDEECSKKGETSKMKYSQLRGSMLSLIKVDLNAASSNPCYGGSPEIDYLGTVTINTTTREVSFGGLIDAFPAFEMYATADGGAGSPLFKEPPPAGNTPGDLFGPANRNITGKTKI